MKAVILAGGFGTRISEETDLLPKPMIKIGDMPIIWHIMKIYSHYGINDFIICCGYKGYVIKEFFTNYFLHSSDITINLEDDSIQIHKNRSENWRVTLVDTGTNVMTGGRLKRVGKYLDDSEPFCLTYGDGLSDLNIQDLIDFHNSHDCPATMTCVQQTGRFGAVEIDKSSNIIEFFEKIPNESRINGGFFVLSKEVLNYIDGDDCIWEEGPLKKLSSEMNLKAFNYSGYWQCMDTLREKKFLESLWDSNSAPWKVWND